MNSARTFLFYAIAYLALLGENAGAFMLRGMRGVIAAPELGLFVIVYLGVCGRGGAIWLTASALAVGYLRDLLIGSPRGMEALAFALVALMARALHGRVFLDRFGQLAIVCACFAGLHAMLVVVLGDGAALPSLRLLPPVLASAFLVGPIALRLLRRVDQRVAPEVRTLSMSGDLDGAWR